MTSVPILVTIILASVCTLQFITMTHAQTTTQQTQQQQLQQTFPCDCEQLLLQVASLEKRVSDIERGRVTMAQRASTPVMAFLRAQVTDDVIHFTNDRFYIPMNRTLLSGPQGDHASVSPYTGEWVMQRCSGSATSANTFTLQNIQPNGPSAGARTDDYVLHISASWWSDTYPGVHSICDFKAGYEYRRNNVDANFVSVSMYKQDISSQYGLDRAFQLNDVLRVPSGVSSVDLRFWYIDACGNWGQPNDIYITLTVL